MKHGKRKRESHDEVHARKKSTYDIKHAKHDKQMREYQKWSKNTKLITTDEAILREKHQFLRNEENDALDGQHDWKTRMAVRYYQKLFKEYALADFSRYEEGKVGLRWRTEREVIDGKGQFVCGNKICTENYGLESYEVLFTYMEEREKKECLIKLRICQLCAIKLFHKKIQELKKRHRKENVSSAIAQEEINQMIQGKQIHEDESDDNDT